jgi:DNA-binding NtrC family response regulator
LRQPDSFDLLITDQTMPELTGKDLAQAVHQFKPDLPIILCTGYSNMISAEDAAQYGISAYCSKPLQLNELALTIRRVLDA